MRLSSTNMQARKMLFAAILSICASSSKKISIYNEEMIVARCFIGFIIFSRKSLGKTFKATLDGRIQAIQEESQQFLNPNEVVPPESNEQQRLLRISLRICGTVVESLPMARSAPKCEKTVQALLCRNLNVKSATLPNATSSRRSSKLELGQLRLLEVDNRVVVPAKSHLRIIVTSADVLHSWAVPSSGVKCGAG